MCVCESVCVCMCVCVCICESVCVCVRTCTHMYIYCVYTSYCNVVILQRMNMIKSS